MNRIIISIFIAIQSLQAFSQAQVPSEMSPTTLKSLAKNADRIHDIYTAIDYYEAYYIKRPKDIKSLFRLAQLEELARNYSQARLYYTHLDEYKNSRYDMALYHKARMLKMEGNYLAAKSEFQRFLNRQPRNLDKSFKKMVSAEIAGCDSAILFMQTPLSLRIQNLGDAINHEHIEFSPMPTGENTLIYGAYPETDKTSFDILEETPKRQFYTAHYEQDEWYADGLLHGPMNNPSTHTGNGVYSPDGKRFYFTRCEENWKLEVICAIWVTKLTSNGWQEPTPLSDAINLKGFSSTQPAIGYDSKKRREVLYFVSNRPDGYGENDIWYVVYDPKKDTYGEPKNAGKQVNTSLNDITPFYFEKERRLFFASDGRVGLGGFDIYSVQGEMRTWGTPTNIGFPLNSSVDELYYTLTPSGERGYFVSNRSEGHSSRHATCCDDIYYFEEITPFHLALKGTVVQTENSNYINGKNDEYFGEVTPDHVLSSCVIGVYMIEGNNDILLRTIETDSAGNYFLDLEKNKVYKLVFERDGYFNNIVEFNTKLMENSDTLNRNVGMAEVVSNAIVLENIEYEFDSAELTQEARTRIQDALLKVLIENPTIRVEIGSHTDSRGRDEYNQQLSQRRAESVVAYLTAKGVQPERLMARGYGESKPVAPNENPDGSDNELGRQKNRRTEFRIVGPILKPSLKEE